MKKAGRRTYLNEDEESLVVASANIEGGHGLPLEYRGVAQHLQKISNASKAQCGDYDIKDKSSMRYFQEVIKCVNKKEDEHKIQTKNSSSGLVKVARLRNTKSS